MSDLPLTDNTFSGGRVQEESALQLLPHLQVMKLIVCMLFGGRVQMTF